MQDSTFSRWRILPAGSLSYDLQIENFTQNSKPIKSDDTNKLHQNVSSLIILSSINDFSYEIFFKNLSSFLKFISGYKIIFLQNFITVSVESRHVGIIIVDSHIMIYDVSLYTIPLSFLLTHLTLHPKGQVSYCHHLASVVRP